MSDYQLDSKFTGKTLVLSFQHMFAMFGATVLVPILSNMSVSVALLAAGLGTICFYFVTKRKVPVFLGSSFAFLPALMSLMGNTGAIGSEAWNIQMGKVSVAIMIAGLVYVILSLIIKAVGVNKVKKLFPAVVIGPVIIIIGMVLAGKTFWNNIIGNYITAPGWGAGVDGWKQWTTAGITALTIVLVYAYAKPKSFLKVIPILLGFLVGYVYALCIGLVSFQNCDWSKIVIFQNIKETFGFYKYLSFDLTAILAIVPLALVTFMEHLGDISANSTVCGKDFMVDPGLNRTVMGDGLATMIAGAMGGPANTTYGENTAVLAITRNYNPRNIFYAAIMAVVLGCFTIFGTAVSTIPSAVIGGASLILFGMIAASGLRALVDGKVDFSNVKNLLIVSITLCIGLGLGAMSLAGDIMQNLPEYAGMASKFKIMLGNVEVSPLAIATFTAILLNLIIPDEKAEQ